MGDHGDEDPAVRMYCCLSLSVRILFWSFAKNSGPFFQTHLHGSQRDLAHFCCQRYPNRAFAKSG